ncbi:MAG: cob(I)yrinic acid a,c-diamide adenosyltransferase [Aeropyrum sp.]|nr:cob(I)yrinic acid a,c-diamide adenosyltransferase [Aeropyrum sp.]MCE4615916.1 cob(I)yrinic acid a,c-diamide adenosyltransferase [Aeropyrum sp.]
MPLYTRTGDEGITWCFFGEGKPVRVPKDHPVLEFYGALDEANSFIGLARSSLASYGLEGEIDKALERLQRLLFNIGFSLTPRGRRVSEDDVEELEKLSDRFYGEPLRRFVLPYGSLKVSSLHVARSVLRRAERRLVTLKREGYSVDPLLIKLLNRASDMLFAAAIALARQEGSISEV